MLPSLAMMSVSSRNCAILSSLEPLLGKTTVERSTTGLAAGFAAGLAAGLPGGGGGTGREPRSGSHSSIAIEGVQDVCFQHRPVEFFHTGPPTPCVQWPSLVCACAEEAKKAAVEAKITSVRLMFFILKFPPENQRPLEHKSPRNASLA